MTQATCNPHVRDISGIKHEARGRGYIPHTRVITNTNAWMAAPQIFATANIYGIHVQEIKTSKNANSRDHGFEKQYHNLGLSLIEDHVC